MTGFERMPTKPSTLKVKPQKWHIVCSLMFLLGFHAALVPQLLLCQRLRPDLVPGGCLARYGAGRPKLSAGNAGVSVVCANKIGVGLAPTCSSAWGLRRLMPGWGRNRLRDKACLSVRRSLHATTLASRPAFASGDVTLRNPITGIVGCCARAASGHAAALPSSDMNSRRFMAPFRGAVRYHTLEVKGASQRRKNGLLRSGGVKLCRSEHICGRSASPQ
jgi:hypothetical protein